MTIPKKLLIIPVTLFFLLAFFIKSGDVFAQYTVDPAPGAPVAVDTSGTGVSPVTTATEQALLNAGTSPELAAQIAAQVATNNGFPATSSTTTTGGGTTYSVNSAGQVIATTAPTIVTTTIDFLTCGNPPIVVTTGGGGGSQCVANCDGGGGTPVVPPVPPPCTVNCGGEEPPPSGDEPPPPAPVLNDLSIAVKAGNQTQYNPNSTANLTYTVTNNGSSAVTSQVGFWPRGGVGPNPLPNCPTTAGSPVSTQAVTMNPGESKDVTFSFNVGASGATAYAYASYNCSPAESNWNNNQAAQTYVVSTATWFESINGDVGSQNSVSVTQTPPAGRYQSTYLLAGQSIDSRVKVNPTGFKVSNYTSQLVPSGGVYNYLAERFLQTAKTTGHSSCNIPSGNANGYNYCSGDATFNAGGAPNGNGVWFIDGNLTIQRNLALAAGDSATFIVRGNITVNTSVTRADGIYIANGTFNDADQGGNMGAQLVINGGVYAQGVNLARALGGAACPGGAACDNTLTPADQFVFDPKYLAGLNSILGTPSISWTETAP